MIFVETSNMRYIIAFFIIFLAFYQVCAAGFDGTWYSSAGNESAQELSKDESGVVSAEITFPGAGLLYLERNRKKMRFGKDDFKAKILSIETKFESDVPDEVKAVLFVKDKEGVVPPDEVNPVPPVTDVI